LVLFVIASLLPSLVAGFLHWDRPLIAATAAGFFTSQWVPAVTLAIAAGLSDLLRHGASGYDDPGD
jgi:hypothetical protein